jgi:hypothetical protein
VVNVALSEACWRANASFVHKAVPVWTRVRDKKSSSNRAHSASALFHAL